MFHAQIKNSKLHFGPILLKKFQDFLAANEGKTVVVDIEKHPRSSSQNAYYWVYLGVIEHQTGENADDLHEYFKRKLLSPVFKTIRGEEIKLPRSTTDLSKVEFSEYLDKVSALTGVPLPDPIEAGYLPH